MGCADPAAGTAPVDSEFVAWRGEVVFCDRKGKQPAPVVLLALSRHDIYADLGW